MSAVRNRRSGESLLCSERVRAYQWVEDWPSLRQHKAGEKGKNEACGGDAVVAMSRRCSSRGGGGRQHGMAWWGRIVVRGGSEQSRDTPR